MRRIGCRLLLACCIAMAARADSPGDPPAEQNNRWESRLRQANRAASSPYLPLDSWIYPAFERLVAWGYASSTDLGLRPWTRLSLVRMLANMEDQFELYAATPEAEDLFHRLREEFQPDYEAVLAGPRALQLNLDSIYERTLGIAGGPLNDSFHFGQTIVNDYGRPDREGANQIAGIAARAGYGRFSFSFRGEYQYAPGAPVYSQAVRQAISVMDDNPIGPAAPAPATNGLRILDANASVHVLDHEISVGKSEMWWGPGEGGAFTYSNNAEPIYMLRINRVEPLRIPLLSRILGPLRYDLFLGHLDGHASPPSPWIQGQKVTFRPSANFEFGVSRTIVFAGEGHVPLTFGAFWNSFTSFSNVPDSVKFSRSDPGARYSGFDFSYRVPYLRDWLTLYADSMAHDDVSPLSAPRRAAMRPGIYLSRIPHAPRFDLRAEGVYTDFPTSRSHGGQFFYFEDVYHDAYTNKQYILGDWIGREAKGAQVWLTRHLSALDEVQLAWRRAKSASDFVPGGTTQNDFSLRVVRRAGSNVELNAFAQVELWKAPLLAEGLRTDATAGLQLTYFPRWNWMAK